jgi:hypothetical protein
VVKARDPGLLRHIENLRLVGTVGEKLDLRSASLGITFISVGRSLSYLFCPPGANVAPAPAA